jgi:hypothetical protein
LDQVELGKQLDYFVQESQFLNEAYKTSQKRLELCSSCMEDQLLRVQSLNAYRAYLSDSLRYEQTLEIRLILYSRLKNSMDLFSESVSSNCKTLNEINISNLIFEVY